jgi:DeoR family transcriptional regulator, deoxyribose operon repressor
MGSVDRSMPGKKRQDRIQRIMTILLQHSGATIRELAESLSVSEMTIRRDLDLLAEENQIRLVHAGAIPTLDGAPGVSRSFSLADGEAHRARERQLIGEKGASLVEPGDVIIVDSGSIAEWLARSLPPQLPLTVLCFALNILVHASAGATRNLVLAGGALQPQTLVFESPEGVSLVRRHRAAKAFLTAGGVSDTLGVTCADANEAELKKAAVASSQSRILLVDSGAFGRVTASWYADLSHFDVIVTDSGISLEYVEIIRNLGIALHVI